MNCNFSDLDPSAKCAPSAWMTPWGNTSLPWASILWGLGKDGGSSDPICISGNIWQKGKNEIFEILKLKFDLGKMLEEPDVIRIQIPVTSSHFTEYFIPCPGVG